MNPLQTSPLATFAIFTAAGIGAGLLLSRRSSATLPAGQVDLDPTQVGGFQPAVVIPMLAAPTPAKWVEKQFTPVGFETARKKVLGEIEALGTQETADQILASCPTIGDVTTIRKLVNIVIESQHFVGSDTLSGCPAAPTMRMKRFFNLLRLSAALRFAKPIPVLETDSLFAFLRDRRVQISIVDSVDDSVFLRPRFQGDLRVNARLFDGDSSQEDQQFGNGLTGMSGRLLLLAQGAYAATRDHDWQPRGRESPGVLAEYWYAVWLATHAGELLTKEQAASMAAYARTIEGLAR